MEPVNTQYTTQNTPYTKSSAGLQNWRIISGSSLKMIAVITMLIDHFAAGILGRYLSMKGANDLDWSNYTVYEQWMEQNGFLMQAYQIMRDIGRVAFPIYCFLLVEGFTHTKNPKKYAGRLFLFAIISEIPFDLLFQGSIMDFSYQNIFFTLFFGMLAMMGMNWAANLNDKPPVLKAFLICAVGAICMAAADIMLTDYGMHGVLCIIIMYLFRNNKELQIAVSSCSFLLFLQEMAAPYAYISIALYSGKRGWNLKYFFYLFYPLHLLLLYLLSIALGISSYPSW